MNPIYAMTIVAIICTQILRQKNVKNVNLVVINAIKDRKMNVLHVINLIIDSLLKGNVYVEKDFINKTTIRQNVYHVKERKNSVRIVK